MESAQTAIEYEQAVLNILRQLPTERKAQILDYALFIRHQPGAITPPSFDQLDAIERLAGSGRGERLLERLLADRAQDRDRGS